MSPHKLNVLELEAIGKQSNEEITAFFKKWNEENIGFTSFGHVDYFARKEIVKIFVAKSRESGELVGVLISTIRLISRDTTGIETLMTPEVCEILLTYAALSPNNDMHKDITVFIEAQKCMINTLYNSTKMKEHFLNVCKKKTLLLDYLDEFEPTKRSASQKEWIRELSNGQADECWYFYYKIAFLATAQIRPLRKVLADNLNNVETLLRATIYENSLDNSTQLDTKRSEEALNLFFNIYCHSDENVLSEQKVVQLNQVVKSVVISPKHSYDMKKSALNCLSTAQISADVEVLCKNDDDANDLTDMTFTKEVLGLLETKLNEIPTDSPTLMMTENLDLLAPFFTALSKICAENKHARRYCRMKVLPPLTAEVVKKRPEEENSLRGKIVRLMMAPTGSKEFASTFLFILCKRSVSRMIKYTGFGHSAGMLANMGLLGNINQQKRDSDSEDSDTDDYNAVRDNVNPVTGSLFPPDYKSALENMSEEQKEYEVVKLMDAMNRLMEAGIVKPGTIGEDGKLREVSHVLELTKNAPEQLESEEDD